MQIAKYFKSKVIKPKPQNVFRREATPDELQPLIANDNQSNRKRKFNPNTDSIIKTKRRKRSEKRKGKLLTKQLSKQEQLIVNCALCDYSNVQWKTLETHFSRKHKGVKFNKSTKELYRVVKTLSKYGEEINCKKMTSFFSKRTTALPESPASSINDHITTEPPPSERVELQRYVDTLHSIHCR